MNQLSNFCLLFDTLNGCFSVLFGSTLIYLLITYLLTPWSRILLEKLTGSQLIKKFCAFYGTWRFITMFTRAWQLSLFWARLIQSMPCQGHGLDSLKPILIVPSHLHLSFPSAFFPSGFHTKTLYVPLLSHPYVLHAPPISFFIDMITQIIFREEYRSLSSSLCSFLHLSLTSSLWAPNILLSTLFSNTLSCCSSISVSNQVLHPYKKTSKIIVLCILIFIFLDRKLEDDRFSTEL